jgi:hypothetical protein
MSNVLGLREVHVSGALCRYVAGQSSRLTRGLRRRATGQSSRLTRGLTCRLTCRLTRGLASRALSARLEYDEGRRDSRGGLATRKGTGRAGKPTALE